MYKIKKSKQYQIGYTVKGCAVDNLQFKHYGSQTPIIKSGKSLIDMYDEEGLGEITLSDILKHPQSPFQANMQYTLGEENNGVWIKKDEEYFTAQEKKQAQSLGNLHDDFNSHNWNDNSEFTIDQVNKNAEQLKSSYDSLIQAQTQSLEQIIQAQRSQIQDYVNQISDMREDFKDEIQRTREEKSEYTLRLESDIANKQTILEQKDNLIDTLKEQVKTLTYELRVLQSEVKNLEWRERTEKTLSSRFEKKYEEEYNNTLAGLEAEEEAKETNWSNLVKDIGGVLKQILPNGIPMAPPTANAQTQTQTQNQTAPAQSSIDLILYSQLSPDEKQGLDQAIIDLYELGKQGEDKPMTDVADIRIELATNPQMKVKATSEEILNVINGRQNEKSSN